MTEPVDFQGLKIGAILNTSSGSCDETTESQMIALFDEAGLKPERIWCGKSKDLANAFEEMDSLNLDVLVILGGDGTIRSAAARTAFDGPLLIPLPGGTMNVLPQALYGAHPWQEILKNILAAPQIKIVSGGEVSGERFFISAIIGAPALWANAREALREGDMGLALQHGKVALDNMFAHSIEFNLGEANHGTAEALVVTCPLISAALDDNFPGFEAAAIDLKGAGDALSIATSAAFGAWRDNDHITLVRTPEVTVTSEKDIPVILDGETVELGNEVQVKFVPEAFRALVP